MKILTPKNHIKTRVSASIACSESSSVKNLLQEFHLVPLAGLLQKSACDIMSVDSFAWHTIYEIHVSVSRNEPGVEAKATLSNHSVSLFRLYGLIVSMIVNRTHRLIKESDIDNTSLKYLETMKKFKMTNHHFIVIT